MSAPARATPTAPSDGPLLPRRRWRSRLGWRVTLLIAALLLVVGGVSAWKQSSDLRTLLIEESRSNVVRLAEVVRSSTRHSMLATQSADVSASVRDIARLEDIEHVRIFDKKGRIVYSGEPEEVGTVVDMDAEACTSCHQSSGEESSGMAPRRWRMFDDADGGRVLASTSEIRNEPSCWTAACHAHDRGDTVLGIVDVGVSLREVDRRVSVAATGALTRELIVTLVVCALAGFTVMRFVGRPLQRLLDRMRTAGAGDLESRLPEHRDDELGDAAREFNLMLDQLRAARHELEHWAATLEEQVGQRTKELKSAQAQVMRAEKLSSLGLLAAGVAHELNSPLTGILTFSHLLHQRTAEGSADREDLELIINETNRCAAIIRQLLDMARERAPERRVQDVVDVLRRAISLVENQSIFHDVTIETRFAPDLPQVACDESQLEQVFLNLLINAAEAMPGGGRLTISAERLPAQEGATERVRLCVSDTGTGIPEDALDRVFDPFFTLKEVGKGTGLGLSVSYGIIERHGGTFEVESTLGQGATFTITLPAHRAEVQAT